MAVCFTDPRYATLGTLTLNQMTVTKIYTLDDQRIFDYYEETSPNVLTDALQKTLLIGTAQWDVYIPAF